ncbi:MAG: zinc-ribbon domain-containing protein, partial [Clostridia bacterium]|nr:zinc-ribbon domain-containing protein [Clostridia bacterium]
MFCRECGANVPEGVKFCPACGAKNEGNAAQAPVRTDDTVPIGNAPAPAYQSAPAAAAAAAPPKKKRTAIIVSVIAIVLALAVIVLFIVFRRVPPGPVPAEPTGAEQSQEEAAVSGTPAETKASEKTETAAGTETTAGQTTQTQPETTQSESTTAETTAETTAPQDDKLSDEQFGALMGKMT